ncbi:hypothetical protein, partial [Weissella cibaria]|uniref:hypothetical protein n=1 Tax=Weissella cibaria TaxID=137591 RepID=UPI00189DE0F6
SYKKCSSAISLQGREKSVRKSSIRAYKFDERDIDEKYQALHGSLFPGNNYLAEQVKQGWNNDTVEARQNEMNNKVVVIWR